MSFKDRLKSASNWTVALASIAMMNSAELKADEPIVDNVNRNAPLSSVSGSAKEYLDYKLKKGSLVNGETAKERQERFQKIRAEQGAKAMADAIYNEDLKTIEMGRKTENGYLFEKYYADKKSSDYESYYPNGNLWTRSKAGSEKAEGFYPDGSKQFDRTSDGIETRYHPGGKKGEEKIKETPHGIYDSYDVLDEQGRRTEHHHAARDSDTQLGKGVSSLKDVKQVDLYNPETKKLEATYTLDEWSIKNGRIASIGFVDKNGEMKTVNFPKSNSEQHYVSRLTTKLIKQLYTESQEQKNNLALQKAMQNRLHQK